VSWTVDAIFVQDSVSLSGPPTELPPCYTTRAVFGDAPPVLTSCLSVRGFHFGLVARPWIQHSHDRHRITGIAPAGTSLKLLFDRFRARECGVDVVTLLEV